MTTLLTGVGARDANASKKYGFWSFMTTITGRWWWCENQNKFGIPIQQCPSLGLRWGPSSHVLPFSPFSQRSLCLLCPWVLKVKKPGSGKPKASHGDSSHLLSHVGEAPLSENNAMWKRVKRGALYTGAGWDQIWNESGCKKLRFKMCNAKLLFQSTKCKI